MATQANHRFDDYGRADFIKRIEELEAQVADLTRQLESSPAQQKQAAPSDSGAGASGAAAIDVERLQEEVFNYVIERLQRGGESIQVSVPAPEIEVVKKREVIKVSSDTVEGRVALLIAEGFFDRQRTAKEAFTLIKETRGFPCGAQTVYDVVADLTMRGFFTKTVRKRMSYYKAVEGMKVNIIQA